MNYRPLISLFSWTKGVVIMPSVARLGDKVNMNCPHGAMGTIISCSSNIEVNGRGLARQGDTVQCDLCGITRTIDYGSPNVDGNDVDVARIHDPATGICNPGLPCCPHTTVATIATGSEDTFANGGN